MMAHTCITQNFPPFRQNRRETANYKVHLCVLRQEKVFFMYWQIGWKGRAQNTKKRTYARSGKSHAPLDLALPIASCNVRFRTTSSCYVCVCMCKGVGWGRNDMACEAVRIASCNVFFCTTSSCDVYVYMRVCVGRRGGVGYGQRAWQACPLHRVSSIFAPRHLGMCVFGFVGERVMLCLLLHES